MHEILDAACEDEKTYKKAVQILSLKNIYERREIKALEALSFRDIDKGLDFIFSSSGREDVMQNMCLFLRLCDKKKQEDFPGLTRKMLGAVERGGKPFVATIGKFLNNLSCVDHDRFEKILNMLAEKEVYNADDIEQLREMRKKLLPVHISHYQSNNLLGLDP
jgi:hypothetical protein